MYKAVRVLTLIMGFMMCVTTAQAETRCAVELDLTCPEGQVLQGISNDGIKHCVNVVVTVENSNFGGVYVLDLERDCYRKNPFTGDCSCPAGFTASLYHSFDNKGELVGEFCDEDIYMYKDDIPSLPLDPPDRKNRYTCDGYSYQCTR